MYMFPSNIWLTPLAHPPAMYCHILGLPLPLIVITLDLVSCRLVLDSWDDLYLDNGQVDVDRLNSEADLLGVTTEPYQECPEMELEVQEFEVFLREDGGEVRDTLQYAKLVDTFSVRTVRNINHSWIQGTVTVR